MSDEQRLTELEIHIAGQHRIIEELSSVVAEQWKTIDQISAKLNALTSRFLALEEQGAPETPVTKPPHW